MKEIIVAYDENAEKRNPVMGEWVGELIRCKDCEHRGNHNICPVFSPRNDFYCGYGERKQSD